MVEYLNQAVEVLGRLHQENCIDYSDYLTIMNGLCDIETLRDRDDMLEELWEQFTNIPVDPETECIEREFLDWPVGTHREEIWRWFDRRYSGGIACLLYGSELDPEKVEKLVKLGDLAFECESSDCCFNHKGVCRFALVHERKPRIHDAYGCLDYSYKEGIRDE